MSLLDKHEKIVRNCERLIKVRDHRANVFDNRPRGMEEYRNDILWASFMRANKRLGDEFDKLYQCRQQIKAMTEFDASI